MLLLRFGSKLIRSVLVLVVVSFLVFGLVDLAPGDAARSIAGESASPQRVEEVRGELGLNDPLLERYGRWLGSAAHGDLGTSITTNTPVTRQIIRAAPATASLIAMSMIFAIATALGAGILAALHPRQLADRAVTVFTALSLALPSFWIALVLASEFAVKRRLWPAVGYVPLTDSPREWLSHLVLPSLALALALAGEFTRQLRGSLLDALGTDYVLAARARGVRERRVVTKHALKNAAIPVVTVLSVRLAGLIGGTVIIESIFNLNGVGSLASAAVLSRDVPVVLGVTVFTTAIVLVINLLVEMSYSYFNPKVRRS